MFKCVSGPFFDFPAYFSFFFKTFKTDASEKNTNFSTTLECERESHNGSKTMINVVFLQYVVPEHKRGVHFKPRIDATLAFWLVRFARESIKRRQLRSWRQEWMPRSHSGFVVLPECESGAHWKQ